MVSPPISVSILTKSNLFVPAFLSTFPIQSGISVIFRTLTTFLALVPAEITIFKIPISENNGPFLAVPERTPTSLFYA